MQAPSFHFAWFWFLSFTFCSQSSFHSSKGFGFILPAYSVDEWWGCFWEQAHSVKLTKESHNCWLLRSSSLSTAYEERCQKASSEPVQTYETIISTVCLQEPFKFVAVYFFLGTTSCYLLQQFFFYCKSLPLMCINSHFLLVVSFCSNGQHACVRRCISNKNMVAFLFWWICSTKLTRFQSLQTLQTFYWTIKWRSRTAEFLWFYSNYTDIFRYSRFQPHN